MPDDPTGVPYEALRAALANNSGVCVFTEPESYALNIELLFGGAIEERPPFPAHHVIHLVEKVLIVALQPEPEWDDLFAQVQEMYGIEAWYVTFDGKEAQVQHAPERTLTYEQVTLF
jgi:hypothetical protein